MYQKHFKIELEKLKVKLEKQLMDLTKRGFQPLKESISELSGYDNHPADLGAETFERSKDLGLKNNTKAILEKVNHALERVSTGTYGVCEKCGEAIETDRLQILPYTAFCADCKMSKEEQYSHRERPLEEEVLKYPFSRSFFDGTDKVEYDGEDAWQDVAQYGTSSGPQDVPEAIDNSKAYIDSDEVHGAVEKCETIAREVESNKTNKERHRK